MQTLKPNILLVKSQFRTRDSLCCLAAFAARGSILNYSQFEFVLCRKRLWHSQPIRDPRFQRTCYRETSALPFPFSFRVQDGRYCQLKITSTICWLSTIILEIEQCYIVTVHQSSFSVQCTLKSGHDLIHLHCGNRISLTPKCRTVSRGFTS